MTITVVSGEMHLTVDGEHRVVRAGESALAPVARLLGYRRELEPYLAGRAATAEPRR